MRGQARRFTLFLIVFFLSFQVGYHFWPKFSYVSGVRVDYLSPTLYVLDFLIILFILLNFRALLKIKLSLFNNSAILPLAVLFILDVLVNVYLAKSQAAHIFGIIKIVEFSLFTLCVAKSFKKSDIVYFVDALCLTAIITSVLAIWQFLNQGSVGGIFYFLGERTFNLSTIGISTVNLGQQILRPYATFPHPNVLAFFLLTTIVFASVRVASEKQIYERFFLIISATLSITALFLTFSRLTILLSIGFLFYVIYTKQKSNLLYFMAVLIILFAFLISWQSQFLSAQFLFRGFDYRQELFIQSFQIISKNLYFGTGVNNFFINQVPLIKNISPIVFQPVHNIFVLAFLSLGLIGWWVVPAIFVLSLRSLNLKLKTKNQEQKNFYTGVVVLLISVIIVGMFDHFFITLEQGQIMLGLIFGLSFTKL